MAITCSQCNHSNRDGARYCDRCGARLAAHSLELRQGTVLFCDLVRSTDLGNRLDPEELTSVYRVFRQRVNEVCKRHGGYLDRVHGDGAFVVFGYPQAREDAADAAVRAGLDVAQAMALPSPLFGVTLSVRVGIASGTLVVGDVTDEAGVKEQVVLGPVPNLAARLASAASPGGVVIAAATRRVIGRSFEYRDLGAIEVKGFDAAERAWQVLAVTSIASRFEARRDVDSPGELVGRAEPLAELTQRWADARAGRGRAVVLLGEAGIGKSKLARTLRALALQDGASVLEIDCTPRTRNTPLYPLSVLCRRLAGIHPGDADTVRQARARDMLSGLLAASRLAEAVDYFAPLLGLARPVTTAESPERSRERTIEFLVDAVSALAAQRPLFVLCEDLHWADASTLLVIHRLCERLGESPALLVATTRPAPEAPVLELREAVSITLGPLADRSAVAMVNLVAQGLPLQPDATARIVRLGEGVPLYLEELTRDALESATHPGGVLAIPQSLQGIVEARLERISGVKRVVQAASVIGREFSVPLLEQLLPTPRTELHEAIARLVDSGLLRLDGGPGSGRVSFHHALLRDAVYQSLLRSDRQQLHASVAQLLMHRFRTLPEATPDAVAHHLAAAARFEEAVRWLVDAAADTSARAAYLESAAHSRAGMDLLDRLPDSRSRHTFELQLRRHLAVALAATRGYAAPEVEQAYAAARALCSGDADPLVLFPIVRGMATFYIVRCDLRSADELSDQCVRLAEQAARVDLMIEALTARGYTSLFLGDAAAGRAALERCIALYEENDGRRFAYDSAQDPATAAWSQLAGVAWSRGEAVRAEQSIARALEHAEQLRRPFDQVYALCHAAGLRNVQRRFEEARELAGRCIDISERHGFGIWLICGHMQQAIAQASLGTSKEATDRLRASLDGYIGAGAELNAPFFLWGLARGLRLAGDVAGARAAVAEALRRAKATGETTANAELRLLQADLDDDPAQARVMRTTLLTRARAAGALTVALRAALALDARACAARDALEGKTPYPDDPDWIVAALRSLTEPQTA